ncbi:MAG: peptide-binding protein [Reyranella sp.]|uniref:SH3 domain-containing protein n=1 Tax=Reyranella sp. TaxID=1929291 RepID=UPI0012157635|nr:SH3 domain-containing protein [Reyranella sp.]TAJ97275.1 MAG: peptide-binding protein [Reyranella sp.]TBR25725.1 MAG: peptide-binding protein [Reyranella sp.]
MFFVRYFLIALLVGMLALDMSTASAQQMVSVAREEVNVRSGPGTNYSAEWVLGRGFPLKVVGRRGDWLQVRDFENDKGWILRQLTGSTPYHIVKVKIANVRSQPSTSSRIVGKVSYGDPVKTLEHKSGWVKVQRDGGLRGWISRKLLWGW